MKKFGLIVSTAVLALAATGCQNWTGKNTRNCSKSGKCGHYDNTACDKKNMQCNKNNAPAGKHCGPKYQNNCRCSPRNQAS